MIKKTLVTLLVTIFVLAQAHVSSAQTADKSLDTWTLLGTKTVDYTIDRDVVLLEKSGSYFKSLKFIVKNGTLNMHKCTVHFVNGESKVVDFPEEVNYANDGRVLDLLGNTKSIEKVTFWYDTKNTSNNKSIVELWGKQ